MAHMIEDNNMFSVAITPWHGLGIVLGAPPTSAEAEKSVINMNGTTSCSGNRNASKGTAINPEPKPEMPRTK